MVNGLRTRFDAVIIDSPALLASGDGEVVSRHVDKTVVVAEADASNMGDLEAAVNLVRMSGGLVSGVVLVEPSRSVGKASPSFRSTPSLGGRLNGRVNGDEPSAGRPVAELRRAPSRPVPRHLPRTDPVVERYNAEVPRIGSANPGDETPTRS